MSSAVAAARKRRAGIQSVPPSMTPSQSQNPPVGQPSQQPPAGLTLQQVINVINARLLTLENAEKERKERESVGSNSISLQNITTNVSAASSSEPLQDDEIEIPIGEILADYNQRFEILTQEIADLKELVLKLQSYTMDVNRTLLEDRFIISTENAAASTTDLSESTHQSLDTTAAIASNSDVIQDNFEISDNLPIQMNGLNDSTISPAPITPIAVSAVNKKKGAQKNVSIPI